MNLEAAANVKVDRKLTESTEWLQLFQCSARVPLHPNHAYRNGEALPIETWFERVGAAIPRQENWQPCWKEQRVQQSNETSSVAHSTGPDNHSSLPVAMKTQLL